MEYKPDVQLILNSLNKERKELSDKLSEIDKLIKRIKYGNVNLGLTKGNIPENDGEDNDSVSASRAFPLKADLKVQVIRVMDILGEASKLNAIQEKYKELTGIKHNLREVVRSLNKHDILKLLQPKGIERGLYWIKAEWLENGVLKDKHKFEGFDLLFTEDSIEFK
ncbi:MAG: hypothetical protein P4L51_01465 [Puia sp.]|nr:hypothetical protein [Puia sp.]